MRSVSVFIILLLSAFNTYAAPEVNNGHGEVIYHTNFPVEKSSGTIERLDLSQEKYQPLILSNLVAGVLLAHMIDETYPGFQYNRPYVYGSLFGQLLQENISTASYEGGNYINNEIQRAQLLASGQGGPYQLNDYSKRLPGVDTKGSLGLINYVALQKMLGYSINSQDNGEQTSKVGPESLDNVYFGPIAAAYFHLNDLNRLEVINQPSWGPEAHSWGMCKNNIKQGKFLHLDMILNAAYNAGTYSDILKTTIDLCAYPNELASYVKKIDDYSLNDADYITRFQFTKPLSDGYEAHSLPAWYEKTTFVIYPRQIRYYIDQLQNDNARLKSYDLETSNALIFSMQSLSDVFEKSMMTLGYVDSAGKYQMVNQQDAQEAFKHALESQKSSSTMIDFSDSTQRDKVFTLLNDAIKALETKLDFKFNMTTEKDYTFK